MVDKSANRDVALARLAAGQHGVVSIAQLVALELSREAVRKRVLSGRSHRLHRGVYAVGHTAPSLHRDFMAAVLACGEGAVLSHTSAAAHWGFLKPLRGPVHVSLPILGGRRRRSGIVVHRCISLARSGERLTTVRTGVSVTTPTRTVEDLKGEVAPYLVRRATRQAELAGYSLGSPGGGDRTRSDLESGFLRLCRRYGIPAPEVNVEVGRWIVDFLWREQGVAAETDFYGYHRGRIAFQDDRARDLDLRRQGLAVHRFSEEQVNERPAEVAADLRDALGLAS
jgi:Transcriptional regulator, AbiEi antitoxin/Protein of unknown function (DUF559)